MDEKRIEKLLERCWGIALELVGICEPWRAPHARRASPRERLQYAREKLAAALALVDEALQNDESLS